MKNYFFRCTAIFILILSLGVGTAWADEITVYVTGEIFIGTGEDAWDNATSTIKVDVRKGHPECFDCDGFNGLYNQDMTNTGYTYNGYPIYSYTLNQAGAQFRFKHYKSGVFKENYTTDWHSTTNQIYRGYYDKAHHWATYGRDVTFYATPEKMDGSKWEEGTHSLFANFKYGDGESEWKRQQMTKTAYTYNGNAIYTCTMLLPYNVIKKVQFLYNDGSDKELYAYEPSPQLTAGNIDGKIFRGYISDIHTWATYGRDVTVYTVPEYLFKDYSTKFSEDKHSPSVCVQYGVGVSEWKTINMVKTDYTYDNYPIWKATFLLDYNIFKEFQIKYFDKANSQQVGLYQYNQGGNTEYPSSDLDDKLYHGYNGSSHDFFSYRYDVALDMQSGGGGSTSIIAIDGSAMPSATMPGRDGYAFGGYWTETNGGGTQYYNSDGSSTRNWDSRTITTLYAKWTARNYTVNLEDPPTTTPVTVTFDAALSAITPPTKMYYTFDGYWTDNDDTGATLDKQLIDEDGNWKKSISPYTGTSGDNATWIYPNGKSLFAKWDEDLHDVTIAVYPADAGVVQVSGGTVSSVSDVGYVTHSPELTAVPSNAAWVFKEWRVSNDTKLHLDLTNYSQFGENMKITATDDGQTLTAVFEPRFCLVGSIWNDTGNGGMPGWIDYTADFTVNSYTDLSTMNLTCVRSLDPNTTYKFEVHDKVKGKNFGYSEARTFIADQSLLFNTQNNDVLLRVNGHGECTFTISALTSGDLYPTVSVSIPASHLLNLSWANVRLNGDGYKTSDETGGTVSAQTTESGHHFAIHNGEYVAQGGAIEYTATPATGYTFEGWYNNDYNTRFSTTNPYTSSNIQTTENVEAKFVEKATTVTLSNDGHGHVEINGATVTSTTVGVTTHRELTAVPDEGYKFNSWTKVSEDDITLSSTSENPTTLSGNGAGAASGQEVRANFTYRWALKAESVGWGHTEFNIENISTNASGDVVGYVDITLAANTNYEFTITDKQESQTYKNGSGRVFYMTNGNSHNWSFATDKTHNCGITTAGAGTYRFTWNITDKKMTVTYPNFVIYRNGDKADDPRAQNTDVESYEGGTIEKAIEFRMKVQTIDQWYSLSLPFAVSAVKVWDDEDGRYYDIVPYYRTDGKFYTGHYIIRKPETVTNYAIETFEEKWVDPENSAVLPEKNIPYIIQWHNPYFLGKYISFFGSTNQAIPSDFNAGEAPSADDVVNVFGNNTMHSGTVMDAYLLDKDYGPSGAWLREDIGTDRTILPFECFIRASQQGTARYRIIRRGMEIDTPTALEQISNHQSPMTIRVYTITGVLIGEYNDCSFQDAAHRIATDHNEGIYILRSENESMKLLLGGK